MNPKIVSLSRLRNILKNRGKKKIVFTNGCFDILHSGHVKYLNTAGSQGDCLIVGLNTDASTRRLKGRSRPVNPQKDRAEVLAALESVDYVVFFDEDTPERLIRRIAPDVLVKGADWDKSAIAGARFVSSYGGKVLTLPYVKGRSTTNIIRKIKSGR